MAAGTGWMDGWMGPPLQSSCKMPAFPGCPFPFRSGRCLCRVRLSGKVGFPGGWREKGSRPVGGLSGREGGGEREAEPVPFQRKLFRGRILSKDGVKAGCSPRFCGVGPPLFLSRLPPLPTPLPVGCLRMDRSVTRRLAL